jgi:hypothetical protein
MKTVLVTGSRDWADYERLSAALYESSPAVVIHGGSRGADQMAGTWARRAGVAERVFPAQWSTHGKRAGFLRNKEMVDSGPDLVLAFIRNGSRGASMTVDLARGAGLEVLVFEEWSS